MPARQSSIASPPARRWRRRDWSPRSSRRARSIPEPDRSPFGRRRRDDRGPDLRRAAPASRRRGARRRRLAGAGARRGAAAGAQPRTRRGPQRRARAGHDAAGRVRRHRRRAAGEDGSNRCSCISPTLVSRSSRRVSRRPPMPSPVAWYERSNSPLDLGPEPARIRAGYPRQLRPGGGDRVPRRRPPRDRRLRRVAPLRRGRRPRVAPRRGRLALPVRAGGRGRPRPTPVVGGVGAPADHVRLVGRHRSPGAIPARWRRSA